MLNIIKRVRLNKSSKLKAQSSKLSERGFSLIEVLIAIALSGIIASGIVVALGTSAKTLTMVNSQETAKDVAITAMEDIRSQPYSDVYDTNYTPPDSYTVVIDVIWLNLNEQQIDVNVSFNGKPSLTLTDYRTNY